MKQDRMMVHNPYVRDRGESDPLSWDTSCPFISDADLGSEFRMDRKLRMMPPSQQMVDPYATTLDGAFTTETADKRQWSYWPIEVPVLPAKGHKWFDYGPLARGMHLWGQVPTGFVPSAEEQKKQLSIHAQNFAGGKIPARLNYWLKEHGLQTITDYRGFAKVGIFATMFLVGLAVFGATTAK